jgi:hypothetical protein
MNRGGASVIVWQGPDGDGADAGSGIFGQRYDPKGIRIGGEFRVHQRVRRLQRNARVGLTRAGEFAVVWEVQDETSGRWHVLGRWYDAAGKALSGEAAIEQSSAGDQPRPGIAMSEAGDSVVAWYGRESAHWTLFARMFATRGAPNGPEFRAAALHNSGNRASGAPPAVGIDERGNFVMSWEDFDRSGFGIYARRYAASGEPLGQRMQINSWYPGNQVYMSLAMSRAGAFIIAWHGAGPGSRYDGIYARRFGPGGEVIGDQFRINDYLKDSQAAPAVAVDGRGDAIFAWQSSGQDGDGWGIFARRYMRAVPAH